MKLLKSGWTIAFASLFVFSSAFSDENEKDEPWHKVMNFHVSGVITGNSRETKDLPPTIVLNNLATVTLLGEARMDQAPKQEEFALVSINKLRLGLFVGSRSTDKDKKNVITIIGVSQDDPREVKAIDFEAMARDSKNLDSDFKIRNGSVTISGKYKTTQEVEKTIEDRKTTVQETVQMEGNQIKLSMDVIYENGKKFHVELNGTRKETLPKKTQEDSK